MPTSGFPNRSLRRCVRRRRARVRAFEGKSVDELTEEAAKRLLSQRLLEKFRQQAEERRGSMTETEVEETVNRAISEYRAESRHKAGAIMVTPTEAISAVRA